MALSSDNGSAQCYIEEDDLVDSDVEQCMIKQSHVSAPVRSSKNFQRQVSAPVHSSRLANCKEDVDGSVEPELEPDINEFDNIPGPSRQVSVMSDFSTKGPSRQVSAMSSWSVKEWDPSGTPTIKRLETEEAWPSWADTNPQLQPRHSSTAQLEDEDQSSSAEEESSTTFMIPYPPMGAANMIVNPSALAGMMQAYGPLYGFQPYVPVKQAHGSTRPPFQRKRESLIDLAKQRKEQQASLGGARSAKHENVAASAEVKFCGWCGGRVLPNSKFCVYCGNERA
jgi:hypothetical protein